MTLKILLLAFLVTLFLVPFLTREAYSIEVEEFPIKGSGAYLPFELAVTFAPTQDVQCRQAAEGATRPECVISFESIVFRTGETERTDTYLLTIEIHYQQAFNQTLRVSIISANELIASPPLPVIASDITLRFRVETAIKPTYPSSEDTARAVDQKSSERWNMLSKALENEREAREYFEGIVYGTFGVIGIETTALVFLLYRAMHPTPYQMARPENLYPYRTYGSPEQPAEPDHVPPKVKQLPTDKQPTEESAPEKKSTPEVHVTKELDEEKE